MTAVHFNDSDVSKFGIKVGKIYKRGEPICFEGTETATANHLHFTCGLGSATKSIKNNNGKYVTKGNCKKPEEIFFIDKKFNKEMNLGGKQWSYLPEKIGTPVERNENKDQIQVIVPELNVRNKATTTGTKLGFANMGFYNILNTSVANGYTWYEIENGKWIAGKETTWTLYFPKEEIIEVKKENDVKQTETPQISTKEENDTNILPPTETTENEQKNNELDQVEKKENFLITFLKRFVDFLTNIINKKN